MKEVTFPKITTTTGVEKESTFSTYEKDFEYGKAIEQLDYNVQIRNKPTAGDTKYCFASMSGNQSFNDSTQAVVSFNTFSTNDTGMSVTGNRITITEAGVYMITSQIRWNSNATGLRFNTIRVNNSTVYGANVVTGVSGNDTYVATTSIGNLAIGDYIEILGYQNSGGALSLLSGTG